WSIVGNVRFVVDTVIKYYNEKRIQQKLGYQSPINFRKQAA
ncbi:IS3 family transposase, partial [Listeria monocytogenes]